MVTGVLSQPILITALFIGALPVGLLLKDFVFWESILVCAIKGIPTS